MPAKDPEALARVSVLLPRMTELLAVPARDIIVAPDVVPEMLNVPEELATFTPLDDAMLPVPVNARVPPLIVVAPV